MNGQLGGSPRSLDIRALPAPIANAVVLFAAAEHPREQRDRLVEVLRTTIRYLGGVALAARLEHGPGPDGDSDEAQRLLGRLPHGPFLTDREWAGLTRELIFAWRSVPTTHPLPALVDGVGQSSQVRTRLEQLLLHRVPLAHSLADAEAEARATVDESVPNVVGLLHSLTEFFHEARVVKPLHATEPLVPQRAWLLHGPTTLHRVWRSLELADYATPGKPVIVDSQGKLRLQLHPWLLCERVSSEMPEELFFLDGRKGKAVSFVAFPSSTEVWREDVLARLQIAIGE